MTEPIKAALSAEEWARCVAIERSGEDPLTYEILAPATKAMCWVNGNRPDSDPEKFTREDVQLLHDVAFHLDHRQDQQERLDDLAERIEALLPPE